MPPFESSSIENEWPVLLECASPLPDAQKLSALVHAANVPLADEEINVAVAAHRGIAIGPDREDRALHDECADSCRSKLVQNTEELRRHAQRDKVLGALTIEKRPLCLLQDRVSIQLAEARREVAQNAVLSCKLKQPRPISRLYKWGEFLRIGLGRGAFEQDRPLVLNRA